MRQTRRIAGVIGCAVLVVSCHGGGRAADRADTATTVASTTTSSGSATTTTRSAPTTAPPTTTPPDERSFTVSPNSLTVGSAVTVSGSSCPPEDDVVVVIGQLAYSSGTRIEITGGRSDATWKASTKVADGTVLGDANADASCVTHRDHEADNFRYPTVPVRVDTNRRVRVSPGTVVRAGATLTVVSDGPCPYPKRDFGAVELTPPASRMGPIVTNRGPLYSSGNWKATITVPAGTPAGPLILSARCDYSRSFVAFYPDTPITVSP